MSTGQIIVGIVLFAIASAILYVWGLRKSMTQAADLERILLNKSAAHVMQYLKQHPTISQKEMARQIKNVKAGLFWSRKQVQVQDATVFAKKLARYMLEQQLLEPAGNASYKQKS